MGKNRSEKRELVSTLSHRILPDCVVAFCFLGFPFPWRLSSSIKPYQTIGFISAPGSGGDVIGSSLPPELVEAAKHRELMLAMVVRCSKQLLMFNMYQHFTASH